MWAILAGVIGLVAAVVGIVVGGQRLLELYRARVPAKLSWKKVERGVLEIIEGLRRDNFVPDLVVAIGRSGAILGGLIAGNMKNIPIALLDRRFQWDDARRDFVLSDFTEVHITPDCRKILVVIGEVYSGQSLTESRERLKPSLVGKEVRTAALVKSKTTTAKVDYFAYEVDRVVTPMWVITTEYRRHEKPTM